MHKRKRKSSRSSKTQEVNNSSKISLKLLVDKKGPRVLFAEAPKEFVDFLFHIFSLPLGTLIELLGSKNMVGCLGKLKDSIESFHGNYLQPGIEMDDIFNPKTAFNGDTFLLSYDPSYDDQSGASEAVYRCSNAAKCQCCRRVHNPIVSTGGIFRSPGGGLPKKECANIEACRSNVTLHANSMCPGCSGSMNVKMTVVMPREDVEETKEEINKKLKGGYVKEVVTYMVMDDLVVKPMSTISSITLINKFGVKNLGQLEEKVVSFGKDEGLKLLLASLKTDKVLTTIFMH